jgi:outer membrane immunogenic protein
MDDWTGFSVGLLGGALDADDEEGEVLLFDRNLDGTFGETVTTSGGADAFSPGFCGGQGLTNSAAGGCDDDKEGYEGAVRVGYDVQWGGWVVGAVVEVGGTSAEDSVTGFSSTPAGYSFKRSLHDLTAARLRLGYVVGPVLVYGTGGVARGSIDNRFFTTNSVNSFTALNPDEQDLDGVQYGGGLEWRLAPNLSLVGEYVRTELDADDPFVIRVGRGAAPATNPFILAPNSTGTDIIRSSDEFTVNALRIGMVVRY